MLRSFDPAIAVVMGVEHGGPYFLMKALPEHTKVMFCTSILPHHAKFKPVYTLFKKHWLARSIRRAGFIHVSTFETRDFLERLCGPLIKEKPGHMGLPVAMEKFAGSRSDVPAEAAALRAKVGRIIIMAGRPTPIKRNDLIVGELLRYIAGRPDCGFVYAGLGLDEESTKIREVVRDSAVSDRCCLLPLVDGGTLGALYGIADVSVMGLVSIAVQQSIACGCPVVLPNNRWCAHLVKEGVNGTFYLDPQGTRNGGTAGVHELDAQFDLSGLPAALDRLQKLQLERSRVAASMNEFSIRNHVDNVLRHFGFL